MNSNPQLSRPCINKCTPEHLQQLASNAWDTFHKPTLSSDKSSTLTNCPLSLVSAISTQGKVYQLEAIIHLSLSRDIISGHGMPKQYARHKESD